MEKEKKPPATEVLMSVEEVAAWLQVSPEWVRQHANGRRRPALPRLKMGSSKNAVVRFRRADVQAFIDQFSAAV